MILSPSISSPLSIPEKTLRGTISYFRHGEWLPKERLTMCYLLNFISYNVIYITSHITFLLLYVLVAGSRQTVITGMVLL